METLDEKANKVYDLAVYLQLMGAFVPEVDFHQLKQFSVDIYEFIKKSSSQEIEEKLPKLELKLNEVVNIFVKRFPPKIEIQMIAKNWNDFFKNGIDVLSYGVTYGWLETQMDLSNFKLYEYVPYHFRIGIAAHKGHYGIEEEFLLKDAFNFLVKAEHYYTLLFLYGEKLKSAEGLQQSKQFESNIYTQITDIKYEVSAFSRLTIISFYAFVEGFINSTGYSYLQRNKQFLTSEEIEILQGSKKGKYLSLKFKMEKFQYLINCNKKINHNITDPNQITEPFISFFDYYEQLRNSSVHYSPIKEQIWHKPQDWIERAKKFSQLAIEVSGKFWSACYANSEGPEYLGKLDYEKLYTLSKDRIKKIKNIENEIAI